VCVPAIGDSGDVWHFLFSTHVLRSLPRSPLPLPPPVASATCPVDCPPLAAACP
jgi:hypothetical protein